MTDRIVIVGGGTGGTVLANRLADELRPELDAGDVEVRLVTDDPDHVYKPVNLYVAFGEKEVHEGRRPVRDLLDRRVDLVVDRVVDIDTDDRRLATRDGDDLAYDYLALSTGAQVVPEETPGLVEGGHQFYNPDGAERLRDELATFDEGHLVVSVVGVPHMCPVAPLEFAFMAHEFFEARGVREDVDITYTYPIQRAHSIPSLAEWAAPELAARDIDVETFFNVESVVPDDGRIETLEGNEMDYDLLVAIPPHTGDDLVADAGLGEEGWVDVDKHTLAAEHAEDVYAFGDAADLPTSKAGSAAHFQAGPLAQRLASRVRGRVPTATYDGKTVCFVEAGLDEATAIAFEYGDEPVVRPPSKYIHWAKLGYNESYWLTARGVL